MPRMTRWSVPLILVLLAGCQDAALSPALDATASPALASAVTVTEIIDLDVGAALGALEGQERLPFNANVQAVNDSGWVFIGDDLRRRGLVWLDDANGAYLPENLKVLPTELRWIGLGTMTDAFNGRGDYLPFYNDWDTADRVVTYEIDIDNEGSSGWVVRPPLEPPAGFEGPGYAWGISDNRLVVGHGVNPLRTWKSKWNTYVFDSPVAWTLGDKPTDPVTVTALKIPAASTGCLVGHVRATAVNDNGVIVGWAEEFSTSTGSFCPRQAVLWPSATSSPILLPRTTAVPGYSRKVKSQDISFEALHVNNAGVVVGRVVARNLSGSQRAARWRPVGSGHGLPEFHGDFSAWPAALDECGRVAIDMFTTFAGVWGAGSNDVGVRLPVPDGFTFPSGAIWDLVSHPAAGDLVVGEGSKPSSDPFLGGDHVLLWKLPACGQ